MCVYTKEITYIHQKISRQSCTSELAVVSSGSMKATIGSMIDDAGPLYYVLFGLSLVIAAALLRLASGSYTVLQPEMVYS